MKKQNNMTVEDVESYKADVTLDGLEIWYIYIICQTALKDKKSRKKLGVNLDIVKRLNSQMELECKNIELYCKALGE